MRRRARVDANSAELLAACRSLGWLVVDLSRVGGGIPDAVLVKAGRTVWVEIKQPKSVKRLSLQQEACHAALAAHGVTVEIITCLEDLAILGRPQRARVEG